MRCRLFGVVVVTLASRQLIWDFVALVRAITLAVLAPALVPKDRRVDRAAALVILTILTWRLVSPPVG